MGSYFMFQRLFIVCTMIVFAFDFAVSGCSSASSLIQLPHFDTHANQYDPQFAGHWERKAHLPSSRGDLGVGVVNGKLFAIGGSASDSDPYVRAAYSYDPTSDTWTNETPLRPARFGLAVGVIHGLLYAVGGDSYNGLLCAPEHS
jgi:hypothetical protein